MTGLREKLVKIRWLCHDASELTDEIIEIGILILEALVLLESEQERSGEPVKLVDLSRKPPRVALSDFPTESEEPKDGE